MSGQLFYLDDDQFMVSDHRQADVVRHIFTTWIQRQTCTEHRVVPAEIVVAAPESAARVEECVHRQLDTATRGRLVLERRVTWWRLPPMTWLQNPPNYAGMTPILSPTSCAATLAGHVGLQLVVQVRALTLPPMSPTSRSQAFGSNDSWSPGGCMGTQQDHFARYWFNGPTAGPDACSPDASQPYPLDDLLSRIDNLTD